MTGRSTPSAEPAVTSPAALPTTPKPGNAPMARASEPPVRAAVRCRKPPVQRPAPKATAPSIRRRPTMRGPVNRGAIRQAASSAITRAAGVVATASAVGDLTTASAVEDTRIGLVAAGSAVALAGAGLVGVSAVAASGADGTEDEIRTDHFWIRGRNEQRYFTMEARAGRHRRRALGRVHKLQRQQSQTGRINLARGSCVDGRASDGLEKSGWQ